MTKISNLYQKVFTEIPKIQQQEKIYYNLCEDESSDIKTYGLEIVVEIEGQKEKSLLENISDNKDLTTKIITFLYENAVKPSSCLGIVSDILSDFEP